MYRVFPLIFGVFIAGVVCGFGDVIAQTCVEGRRWKQYSLQRTTKMAAIGLCFTVGKFIISTPCMTVQISLSRVQF